MFTGIVKELGQVERIEASADGARLTIRASEIAPRVQVGDSVAINGVCLTVTRKEGERLWFDAVPETLRRSNLGTLKPGDRVNLEDALRMGDAMGGHFVQGHVDTTGIVQRLVPEGNAVVMVIRVGEEWVRYLVSKGSVAVDGVSLTVVDVGTSDFSVWLIPHTRMVTTLGLRRPGDAVNVEFDMLAKYIEKLLQFRRESGGVDMALLRRAGFVE
ncbi:MAG: riboflavin synthase subunit alpha [Armatimonadota bacterium]|nr:MAG: riboflavin synthase subunit alpha [Armatimonadota bacterium]